MFRLHTSNDATKLADALGEQLCAARDNPLVPARVLVPQAGLRRWLQVYLAERMGVIANVEFTAPAQFTWELLRAARPELPERSPFDVEVLRWHIYALLGERLDGAALASLHEYLSASDDPLRRFALSLELARAYERMQGYRREKLLGWERGADTGDWQAELWRRLLPRVGGTSRVARVDEWLRAFDPDHPAGGSGNKPSPPGLPGRLACFACANVSPDVLRMLAVAGRHCDVDFHLPLPSMEYLGDLPRTRAAVRDRLGERNGENPLVLSLGSALSGFVGLLFGYEHVQPDVEHDDYDTSIPRTTLLGRVRDDILKHAAPRDGDRAARPDASLQFHACHTPLREVQAFHDALLSMLDDPRFDPPLQPRDVAVMMPDVAAYQPAIDAVFGGVDREDPRFIPYNLGDLGAAAQHPAAALFLKLLDAPGSRWELDELTDVLATPGVMRRFDLDADALERLRTRLRAAGARWGEDEHARKRAGAGDYREFSWAFAIDRIVAGFAVGDVADALVGGTAPLAGVEGQAFAEIDAALALAESWRRLRRESQRPRNAAAWQAMLNVIFDDLYQPDARDLAETRALERVRAALAKLADDCRATDAGLELPWADLRAHLRDTLRAADPAQRLFTGGVTFCGMVPLRVVPFRVIALLGMQADAFPRRDPGGLDPLLADRNSGRAESGDRDVRADDRLLFLQLLAAARDAFYVSWIGQDLRSNKSLPPSVVVDGLMREVREYYLAPGADEDALPVREPLHPFAAQLFDGTRARSHAGEWLPAAAIRMGSTDEPRFAETALPESPTPAGEVALDDLKRFFDNPARGFLERGLRMRLPRTVEIDADVEPLQPDEPRLRYTLTREMLLRGEAAAHRQQAQLRAEGQLPPGALGEAAFTIARGRTDVLQDQAREFTGGAPPQAIATRIDLGEGWQINGRVEGRYPRGLLRADPGKLDGRRALRAWIDTLFAAAAGDADTGCLLLTLLTKDGELETGTLWYRPIEPDAARTQLRRLVEHMRAGTRAPLPFLPRLAWDSLKCERVSGRADEWEFGWNLAGIAAKTSGDFGGRCELDDDAVAIAWRGFTLTDRTLLKPWHAMAESVLPPAEAIGDWRGAAP
ncbi:MAG TPA: exodeoxyribonuclease V subunit gamma [Rhodanobacteraceae bacterium]|nr:exodeoxyribonuclease V subunit gamma [Rhodanobacteraceae bacterium]